MDESYYHRRLMELEKKVAFLLKELGLEEKAEAAMMEMNDDLSYLYPYLQRGKKIEAIKAYRERTGYGLKEAKEVIDQLEREGRYW